MSSLADAVRTVTRLPCVLCAIAGAIGMIVLHGYAADARWLMNALPGEPPFARTAFALVLLGAVGILRCRDGVAGRRARKIAAGVALAVTLLGGITLIEHGLARDLGIAHVIVEPAGGRPPPIDAVAVMLFGLALLVFDTRRGARARPSEWLELAAGIVALIAIVAHLFAVPGTSTSMPLLAVRPATGIALACLAVGLLVARADAGLVHVATSRGPGGIMFRRLVLPFVFAPAVIGLVVRSALGRASLHDPALLVGTLFAATSLIGVLLLPLLAVPLDRAQARLEGIIGIASDAIISLDTQQRITIFNRGAEQAFGWPASEVLGKPLEILSPEPQRAQVRSYIEQLATAPDDAPHLGQRTRDIIGLRKDGTEFPGEAAISKHRGDDGLTFTIVLRDATRHANLEAQLRRAVAARDEVLGIVAHDLRNPLSTAMLTAELLVRPEHERRLQSRRIAERLTRALGRATRLIEDLLDVTRLESGGGMSIDPHPQALPAIAREAFEMFEAAATAASVALEAKLPPDLPQVLADEARIVQVLGNLIGNAIKFTPRGGHVRVSATRQRDELVISVADTGTGLDADQLAHMFDRFWQARAGDRRGAGLGLAIVKGIVEAHGGRIWAESEPGRGCCVMFTLPIASSETRGVATRARPT